MLKKYLYCICVLVSIKAVFLLPHLYTLYDVSVAAFSAKIVDFIFVVVAAYYANKHSRIALAIMAIYIFSMYGHDLYINVFLGSTPVFLKTYRVFLALYFFAGGALMLREACRIRTQ